MLSNSTNADYKPGSDITVLDTPTLLAYGCSEHPNHLSVSLGIEVLRNDGITFYFTPESLQQVNEELAKVTPVARTFHNYPPRHALEDARKDGNPMLIEIIRQRYFSPEGYADYFIRLLKRKFVQLEQCPPDARVVTLEEMLKYVEKLHSGFQERKQ
jgi:hypothetical protein